MMRVPKRFRIFKGLNYTNHTVMPEAKSRIFCNGDGCQPFALKLFRKCCRVKWSYHLEWVEWVKKSQNFNSTLPKTNDLQNNTASTASLWPYAMGALFSCEFRMQRTRGQALEKWPVEMIERMLPRHLQLIGAAWLVNFARLGWWVDNR